MIKLLVPLSAQQRAVVEHVAAARGATPGAALAHAFEQLGQVDAPGAREAREVPEAPVVRGGSAESGRLPPGTGRAIALARGQTLRVEQTDGDQGADVLMWSLERVGVRLDVARTRSLEGTRPGLGTLLWSSPPTRALARIVGDTAGGHDLLFPACTEEEYARFSGVAGHGSCNAILCETVRPWGLGAPDLHDPLNLWLQGWLDEDGVQCWRHTPTRSGDAVDLEACEDLLVVVCPCANDLFGRTGFEARGLRLEVIGEPCDATGQALRRLPGREPRFDLTPFARTSLETELPDAAADQLAAWALHLRAEAGDAVRVAFFRWWQEHAAGARYHQGS